MISLQCSTNIPLIHPGTSHKSSQKSAPVKFLAEKKILPKTLVKKTILSFAINLLGTSATYTLATDISTETIKKPQTQRSESSSCLKS